MSRCSPSQPLLFHSSAPWLAPLAGWSDLPFRLLCHEYGAAVCCTEMVSAKGLMYHSPGTEDLLRTLPEGGENAAWSDTPLVVQLFGSEASFMEAAVRVLMEQGFVWFDCNMGCSVPKVTRTGAGAAMNKDVVNALLVAKAMIAAAGSGRVGFKLRLGWDENHEVWRDLALGLVELGAGWLTLHPRTAKQGFSGVARWSALKELKQLVSVPVVASGDLFTAEDGVRCLEETGVDTVMYARGALRDPAIFAAHQALLHGTSTPEPDAATLVARIHRHAYLARTYSSEHSALLKMRTIVPRYVRHLPGARQVRQAIIDCRTWEGFEEALTSLYEYS